MLDKEYLKYYIAFITFVVFILLFASCAIKPYSKKQLTKFLEKQYGVKNRFTVIGQIENSSAYLFHDNELNIDFPVINHIAETAIIPFPHRVWGSLLDRGIMYSKREEAIELADKYGLKMIPINSLYDKGGSSTYDKIYISTFSQIEDAVKLYIGLTELYHFEQKGEYTVAVRFLYDKVFIHQSGYFDMNYFNERRDILYNSVINSLKEEWNARVKYGRIPNEEENRLSSYRTSLRSN